MFTTRCPMTPCQREPLDAQYADLRTFRRELATMNVIQKEARARDFCEELVHLRRAAQIDCAGLGGDGYDSPRRLVRSKASRSCFKERKVGLRNRCARYLWRNPFHCQVQLYGHERKACPYVEQKLRKTAC